MLEVKIKKLDVNAITPSYAKHGDAGMDLTATSKSYDEHGNVVYGTGLAFEIPQGYVGYVFPRSSNAKKDLLLSNSVGVIDSGYRGEVVLKFKQTDKAADIFTMLKYHFWKFFNRNKNFNKPMHFHTFTNGYDIGDRIGQIIIMPYPKIQFIEVDELSSTERGNGGFGSTGEK